MSVVWLRGSGMRESMRCGGCYTEHCVVWSLVVVDETESVTDDDCQFVPLRVVACTPALVGDTGHPRCGAASCFDAERPPCRLMTVHITSATPNNYLSILSGPTNVLWVRQLNSVAHTYQLQFRIVLVCTLYMYSTISILVMSHREQGQLIPR